MADTPGTGSVREHNTAAADAALPSMDAAIFVLTADPPVGHPRATPRQCCDGSDACELQLLRGLR